MSRIKFHLKDKDVFQKDQKVKQSSLEEKMKTKALFLSAFLCDLALKLKNLLNEVLNSIRNEMSGK